MGGRRARVHRVVGNHLPVAPIQCDKCACHAIGGERVASERCVNAHACVDPALGEDVAAHNQSAERVGSGPHSGEALTRVAYGVPESKYGAALDHKVCVEARFRVHSDSEGACGEHRPWVSDVGAQNLDLAGLVDVHAYQTIGVVKVDMTI